MPEWCLPVSAVLQRRASPQQLRMIAADEITRLSRVAAVLRLAMLACQAGREREYAAIWPALGHANRSIREAIEALEPVTRVQSMEQANA
jgi:hypothetical protein